MGFLSASAAVPETGATARIIGTTTEAKIVLCQLDVVTAGACIYRTYNVAEAIADEYTRRRACETHECDIPKSRECLSASHKLRCGTSAVH